jgi:heptosyltransferase-2
MEFKTVPHLLIVAPNWLGDAVMALPAIADVVRALPQTRIAVAARPSITPLFQMVPAVEAVAGADQRKHDVALLLPNSWKSAWTAWRLGIPERWGYRSDGRGPLLTRAVQPPPAEHMHQAAYYQYLVRALGFDSGPLEARVDPSPTARTAGTALLASCGWDEKTPLVALAVGAAYGGAKRWPSRSFADLACQLSRQGVAGVLVGSRADTGAAAEVVRQAAGARLFDLTGRTDLPALAGVLVRCRALVSNDSGAMHLGAALGVKVVAMFGPTDERATRPLGRSDGGEPALLTHDVWCRPCLLRECPLTQRCMKGISVSSVLARVQAV